MTTVILCYLGITILITICHSELPVISGSPLIYSKWPSKLSNPHLSNAGRQQLVIQIRNGIRPAAGKVNFIKRPIIMGALPLIRSPPPPPSQPSLSPLTYKKYQSNNYIKRPSSVNYSKGKFYSSPPGPHTGEYVFENPFTNMPPPSIPNKVNVIHMTANDDYSPIHTIPAPNLSTYDSKLSGSKILNEPINNNNIHEYEPTIYPPLQLNSFHQYQVTEPSNDHTIRDPLTGKNKLYAPDPDPSLPTYKVKPAIDPFSQPSQIINFSTEQDVSNQQQQSEFVQYNNNQQQLPDIYDSPLVNHPQLQQHFLQQKQQLQLQQQQQQQQPVQQSSIAFFQGLPMAVYNPSYLVQQSNQLFNQHKQHLFKPNIDQQHRQQQILFNNPQSVASAGQIYAAAQDTINEIQQEFNKNTVQQQPQYAALITQPIQSAVQQNPLTEPDYLNLINFSTINKNNQQQIGSDVGDGGGGGIQATSFYQTYDPNNGDYSNFINHQQNNADKITLANQEVQNQYLHQQHNEGLRIIVPDDDYGQQNDNTIIFGRRSDSKSEILAEGDEESASVNAVIHNVDEESGSNNEDDYNDDQDFKDTEEET